MEHDFLGRSSFHYIRYVFAVFTQASKGKRKAYEEH